MSRLATLDHSFAGNKISQSWYDLWLWEQVLNHFPPKRIYELGTFTGGMAVYLYTQAMHRGAGFMSFDVTSPTDLRNDRKDSYYNSPIEFPFKQLNVLSDEGKNYIGDLIQHDGLSVVFCDNGSKESELAVYADIIKEGDVIAVHDWGTECHNAPQQLTLFDVYPGAYDELNSMTRFFTK